MVVLGLNGLVVPGRRAAITQGFIVDCRVINQQVVFRHFLCLIVFTKFHFCRRTFAMMGVNLVYIYLLF